MAASIEIVNVGKSYGKVRALGGVNLSIQENEFFTLLGPSGCGKTTLLRSIAGFETVSEGEIRLDGQDISGLDPDQRPINTVFQHYALFPHLTILENVEFGLKMLGVNARERRDRAGAKLEMVHLSQFRNRLPAQLSGGQQQRVALARALAPDPKVLLLDEPLSALDLKLRQAMRLELQQLQQETGITFVFVTHDQEEALTMSDRVAVMKDGHVQQVGPPRDIYESPSNRFVADFIGEINLIPVELAQSQDDQITAILPGGARLTCGAPQGGGPQLLCVRPERLTLSQDDIDLRLRLDRVVYLGTDLQLLGQLPDGSNISVRLQNNSASQVPEPGQEIGLKIDRSTAKLVAA